MKTQSLRVRSALRAGETKSTDYTNTMQTISSCLSMMADVRKSIVANIRA